MEFLADMLLVAGAFAAAIYCLVLSRKLTRFAQIEGGVGGAVALLSAQVDDLEKTLTRAQASVGDSEQSLAELTLRAEEASRRLEMVLATMHDLPERPAVVRRRVRVRARREAGLVAAE